MSLFCAERLSGPHIEAGGDEHRTAFERDFDRILFSAPVRRLVDKTQVFPMEKNDSVRNRLTHSHEVSNLARSLTLRIARTSPAVFGAEGAASDASVIAAAVGLAHDVGNPPYGHQGEKAIGSWFKRKHNHLFSEEVRLSEQQRLDLEFWEGNAQAFRLLTRLQVSRGDFGLDLSVATLAALMKYTGPSHERGVTNHPARKKFGFFAADATAARMVLRKSGVEHGQRHPIAYIMEAADDIAYSVIDIEDAIKKRIVSIHDVLAAINNVSAEGIQEKIKSKIDELEGEGRDPAETNDISAQYFRTYVIDYFMRSASECFAKNSKNLMEGSFEGDIIGASPAKDLCKALKKFAGRHAFSHPAVKEIELQGEVILHRLSDFFWLAIEECSLQDSSLNGIDSTHLKPPAPTSFGRFVYSHISQNYRRAFQAAVIREPQPASIRYHQLLLLTDMVSGMTETFASDLLQKFERLSDGQQ